MGSRILIVTDNYLPNLSGHSLVVQNIASMLSNSGFEVLVVADSPCNKSYIDKAGEIRVLRGRRWTSLPYGNALASTRPKDRVFWDFLLDYDPDIIHGHGYGPLIRQVRDKLNKKPFAISTHALPIHALGFNSNFLENVLWKYMLTLLGKSRIITVPSDWMRSRLIDRGMSKEKLRVVPSPIDLMLFRPAMNKAEYSYLVDKLELTYRPLIAYIGRVAREKGLEDLVALSRRRSDVNWLAIGYGDLSLLNKSIITIGKVGRDQLAKMIRSIDVLFFPSINETQGMAALEALASGIPIVVPESSALSEILVEGVNGFSYPKGNISLANKALNRALELHINQDKGVIRSTVSGFSVEKITAEISLLYDELLRS